MKYHYILLHIFIRCSVYVHYLLLIYIAQTIQLHYIRIHTHVPRSSTQTSPTIVDCGRFVLPMYKYVCTFAWCRLTQAKCWLMNLFLQLGTKKKRSRNCRNPFIWLCSERQSTDKRVNVGVWYTHCQVTVLVWIRRNTTSTITAHRAHTRCINSRSAYASNDSPQCHLEEDADDTTSVITLCATAIFIERSNAVVFGGVMCAVLCRW